MGQLQKRNGTGNAVMDLIQSQKDQIARALPKHMNAERMTRIVMTECRKNPKLMDCEPVSFLGAVIQASQLGLEPGGVLGHCYLIPFENRRKGVAEVQFIVGYRGMIDLARRSGQIISLSARTVYENDDFTYCYGLTEDIKHIPATTNRGKMVAVYAVARLKDGGTQFEVMSREEIEEVRDGSSGYKYAVSKGRTDNPWIEAFEEMAKKTVIRRLFKYLPVSIELQTAAIQDEYAEAGYQENPIFLEPEAATPAIPTGKQSLKKESAKEPEVKEAKPDPKNGKPDDDTNRSWIPDFMDDMKTRIDEAKTEIELKAIQAEYGSMKDLGMDLIDELDALCNEIAKEKGF